MILHSPMRIFGTLVLSIVIIGNFGCADMLSTPSIPDGTQSPSTWSSREGAMGLTRVAFRRFRSVALDFYIRTGLFTDELSSLQSSSVDMRYMPEGDPNLNALYKALHGLRGQSRIARGALADYASDLSPAVTGQLFAFEGYAEIWLADLFCSGVPLSTLDYNGDFTLRPSSTTMEVYEHAVALFDSALVMVADSPSLKTLSTIGKGRALLALGRVEEAAMVVQDISVNETYRFHMRDGAPLSQNFSFAMIATVSDNEGRNGLPYLSSLDPRTLSIEVPTGSQLSSKGVKVQQPLKLGYYDSTWFNVASGIEAELIKSEAALLQGQHSVWLSILNDLRTTGTYSGISGTDTLWEAGKGGVARLGPISDPGSADSRINILFAERAFWLFVTGQRQADMRRLIRFYQRNAETVYPTGSYSTQLVNDGGTYGNDITAPIPHEEVRNSHYRGCLSRD